MKTDKTFKKRILGIDPGTTVFGYAIVDEYNDNSISLQSVGVVRLDQWKDHYVKLGKIHQKIKALIKEYNPNQLAIESPYYGNNVQSMLKLGRAQGVTIAVAVVHEVEVIEYSPRKIKQAVTGNGNASKEQVAKMLQRIMKLDSLPKYLDATDALGVAVCHLFQRETSVATTDYKNWGDFVAKKGSKK